MIFTVIIAVSVTVFFWCLFKAVRSVYQHVRLEVVDRALVDDRVELTLNDGSKWRSKYGFVWHSFPDGNRAYLELESLLSHENDRLKLLDQWSGEDESDD